MVLLHLFAFGQGNDGLTGSKDILLQYSPDCDSIPPVNVEILHFAGQKLGKKVDRGECWDFPAAALNEVGAKWDGRMKFGRLVNPEKECVYAGDIVQFEGVRVVTYPNGGKMIESMGPHTAIINKVHGLGHYDLIHQNYGTAGRKVGITSLDVRNITKGRYYIYRPVR